MKKSLRLLSWSSFLISTCSSFNLNFNTVSEEHINEQELKQLAKQLNVTLNIDEPQQKPEALAWLKKYELAIKQFFNQAVKEYGKGFTIELDDLGKYQNFLAPITYVSSDTKQAILELKIIAAIKIFVQNKEAENKKFEKWITEILEKETRGFACQEELQNLKAQFIASKEEKATEKYLSTGSRRTTKSSNSNEKLALKTQISQFIKAHTSTDFEKCYQTTLAKVRTDVDFHGYSEADLMQNRKTPQTKKEIDNFEKKLSWREWLQTQADSRYKKWQLSLILGIGLSLFLVIVGTIIFIYWRCWRYNKIYNPDKKAPTLEQKTTKNLQQKKK